MQSTTEQRAFVVQNYFATNFSLAEIKKRLQKRFPGRRPPSNHAIIANARRYLDHGTSLNQIKGNSVRPRIARTLCVDRNGGHVEGLF